MAEQVIPVLRVAEATRAVRWYARLGFVEEWSHRFEPGLPVFCAVARGEVRLYLSEHTGDARPGTLLHLDVDDVGPVATEFGAEPEDVGWGLEVDLTDPDGNRLRVVGPGGSGQPEGDYAAANPGP